MTVRNHGIAYVIKLNKIYDWKLLYNKGGTAIIRPLQISVEGFFSLDDIRRK